MATPVPPILKRVFQMKPQNFSYLTSVILLFISSFTVISQSERSFDNLVPEHLPIKVKLKAEKETAVKDLNNRLWTKDLELEVKNTGNKPIYFLSFVFTLPEVRMPDNNLFGFSFWYGRTAFAEDFRTKPSPKDVPIGPGETRTFLLPRYKIEGWERDAEDPDTINPTRFEILLNYLSFADGTGFDGPNGTAYDKREFMR